MWMIIDSISGNEMEGNVIEKWVKLGLEFVVLGY